MMGEWHWRRVIAVPHKLCFFAGAALAACSALWWLAMLSARALGRHEAYALPLGLAHGLLMLLAFLPMFFAGFMLTAVPKWLRHGAVSTNCLLGPVSCWLAGWAAFLCGFYSSPALAAAGLTTAAAAWSLLCWRFAGLVRTSNAPDRLHPRLLALAGLLGAIALWGCAAGVWLGRADIVHLGLRCGLWAFCGIVFVTAAHRMLPFFDSAAPAHTRWPNALLFALVALLLGEAALALAGWALAALPPGLRFVRALCEAALGAWLSWLALRWLLLADLRRRLKQRLTAMLWLGFAWLGLAFVLLALSRAVPASAAQAVDLAALHALTMGFMASIMLAMVSRISSAYSGRAVAADEGLWRLFGWLQTAVLLRLLALAWPAAAPYVLVAAALAWAGAVLPWALRLITWFGRARADGRPG